MPWRTGTKGQLSVSATLKLGRAAVGHDLGDRIERVPIGRRTRAGQKAWRSNLPGSNNSRRPRTSLSGRWHPQLEQARRWQQYFSA